MLTERSRLGDESLDDGLDDRDKDDLGLEGRPAESSGERNTIRKVTRPLFFNGDLHFLLLTYLIKQLLQNYNKCDCLYS